MPIISGAKCDRCGKILYFKAALSKKEIIQNLRKEGWAMGKYTKCPKCRPGGTKDDTLQ